MSLSLYAMLSGIVRRKGTEEGKDNGMVTRILVAGYHYYYDPDCNLSQPPPRPLGRVFKVLSFCSLVPAAFECCKIIVNFITRVFLFLFLKHFNVPSIVACN